DHGRTRREQTGRSETDGPARRRTNTAATRTRFFATPIRPGRKWPRRTKSQSRWALIWRAPRCRRGKIGARQRVSLHKKSFAPNYLGSRQGPMRGRDGNIHRGKPGDDQLAMISHLGAMVSVTVGALLAKRFRGEKNFVGLSSIGEGGMQTGSFHEGMNIAAV